MMLKIVEQKDFSLSYFSFMFEEFSNASQGTSASTELREYFLDFLLPNLETQIASLNTGIENSPLRPLASGFLEKIAAVRQALESYNLVSFDYAKADLMSEFNTLYDVLLVDSVEKELMGGPSKDKQLNYLIHRKTSVESGVLQMNVFEEALSGYIEHFTNSCRNFRRLLKSTESFPEFHAKLEEQMLSCLEAKQALQALTKMLEQKQFKLMEKPFDVLRKFSDKYFELCVEMRSFFQALEPSEKDKPEDASDFQEDRNKIASAWARASGRSSPNSSSHVRADARGQGSFTGTANVQKFLNAVDDFEDGEIDLKEFVSVLNWMDQLLESGMKGFSSFLENPPSAYASAPGQLEAMVELFYEGVEDMRQSLVLLRTWSDSKVSEHRETATQICLAGAEKIYRSTCIAQSVEYPAQADFGPTINSLG